MTLAVVSDIHGNWPALKALLARLPPECQIVSCGDFIGYYPYVNEVCDWARSANVLAVRGNHEAMLLGLIEFDQARDAAYRLAEARRTLSPENAAWLAALPTEQRLQFAGQDITLRHASPWDETTYLYQDSPHWDRISLAASEVLVVGHTHRPMIRTAGEGLVVNAGSVGQPRDYNPQACCALLDDQSGVWRHFSVPYDHVALQRHLTSLGYDPKSVEILGRTLPTPS